MAALKNRHQIIRAVRIKKFKNTRKSALKRKRLHERELKAQREIQQREKHQLRELRFVRQAAGGDHDCD